MAISVPSVSDVQSQFTSAIQSLCSGGETNDDDFARILRANMNPEWQAVTDEIQILSGGHARLYRITMKFLMDNHADGQVGQVKTRIQQMAETFHGSIGPDAVATSQIEFTPTSSVPGGTEFTCMTHGLIDMENHNG